MKCTKTKLGLNGKPVYIDNYARYYRVDKRGRRRYVTGAELRDKKE
jgi:hypothetical protein